MSDVTFGALAYAAVFMPGILAWLFAGRLAPFGRASEGRCFLAFMVLLTAPALLGFLGWWFVEPLRPNLEPLTLSFRADISARLAMVQIPVGIALAIFWAFRKGASSERKAP